MYIRCTHIYIHTYVRTYVRTHVRTYIRTYIHAYILVRTYTRATKVPGSTRNVQVSRLGHTKVAQS